MRSDKKSTSGKWLVRGLAVAWSAFAAFFVSDSAAALAFCALSLALLLFSEVGLDLL